jgi:molecular chaperone GrpE|tara:strand:- start:6118 stop:6792 length:675 start_codon:yes stop_codon:yes gene_type:complete
MTEEKIDKEESEILSFDTKDSLIKYLEKLKMKSEDAFPEFESYSFDLLNDEKNKKGMIFFFEDEDSIKEISSVFKGLEEAKKELNNKLLRFAAEFENFKKRVAQEKSQAASYIKDSIFRDLLNFIDNFERGLSLYEDKDSSTDFYKGMKAVFKECDTFLVKNNIKKIDSKIGDIFNPSIHEAIEVKESDEFPKDQIVSIIQSGYLNNEKLLRPVMVSVSSGSES